MPKPYIYWKRSEFISHFHKQDKDYNVGLDIIHEAVYSRKWEPATDYNGCNVVQDDLHPFLPCFIHDYRWVTDKRSNKYDLEFRSNLLRFGYSKTKANMYYLAVRVGSLYYKIRDKWQEI